jgi:hypothetical protein
VLGAWAAVPALVRSSFLPSPPPLFAFWWWLRRIWGNFPRRRPTRVSEL